MTQTQALFEIAKYNGGIVKSLDVKSILIAAKLMKNTKNAEGMVLSARNLLLAAHQRISFGSALQKLMLELLVAE